MNILLTENNFLFSNIKIHENLSVSSSLPGHTALWCEPERSLPGKCSATASGRLWFSFTNNDTHQLRTDRCQDDRAALFCFGNMLSHLGLPEKEKNGQKHHLGADTRPLSQSLPCTRTWNVTGLNVSAGAKRMMPPQGDSLIRRLNYTVAPVQHDMSYLPPLPSLFRSLSLTPLINLQSDCPQDSLVLIRGGNMSTMHAPCTNASAQFCAADRKAAVKCRCENQRLVCYCFMYVLKVLATAGLTPAGDG